MNNKLLKIGSRVAYTGEQVIFGYKNKLELDVRQLKAIPETYIWHIVDRPGNPTLYIIQHEGGAPVDFFKTQINAFPNQDFSMLEKYTDLTFTHTSEDKLTLLDVVKPIPVAEEPVTTGEDQVTVEPLSVKQEINEQMPIGQPQVAPIVTGVVEDEADINSQAQDIEQDNLPPETTQKQDVENFIEEQQDDYLESEEKKEVQFTKQSFFLEKESVNKITTLSHLFFSKQIQEPFSVVMANGVVCKGNVGDYVIMMPDGNLKVEPKDTYPLYYEMASDLSILKIGQEEDPEFISHQVNNYIQLLEDLNVKLRSDLYLKQN